MSLVVLVSSSSFDRFESSFLSCFIGIVTMILDQAIDLLDDADQVILLILER